MIIRCPFCDDELNLENSAKNVLRSKCLQCDILLTTRISGIYRSGYVSWTNEFEEWCKNLTRHFCSRKLKHNLMVLQA